MKMNIKDHNSIIKYGITAGVLWTALSAVAVLIARLQITFFVPGSDFLGYGVIRPVYTTALIYGAFLSFFFAAMYHIIESNEGASAIRFPILAGAGFILHQASVVLGVLAIIAGTNKGREYGEMPWFSDAMFSLAVLLSIVSLCFNLREKETLAKSSIFTIAGIAGIFFTHLLGNISFPYWIAGSVLPFNGIQDAAAQEFYRSGVLGFFILIPTFALLYHFIPAHFKAELYSSQLADFQILTMLVLIPLAGSAGLAFSSSPQISQTIGIIANGALSVSILAGVMNLYYTITKNGDKNVNDGIAKIFKLGILLMLVYAVIRGLAGLRIVQDRFGFTWWNPADISIDAAVYAMPLILGGVYLLLEKVNKSSVPAGMANLHMMLFVLAFIIVVASGIFQGSLSYYNLSAVTEEGALKIASWSQAVFLTTDKGSANIISLHGLSFIGYVILMASLLLGAINTGKSVLSKQ